MVIYVIVFLTAILAIQLPGLIKKRLWKDLIVYLTIFFLGSIYSIGLPLDWSLPNPTKFMEYKFEPVSQFLEKFLS
jgi:hypothetical protein